MEGEERTLGDRSTHGLLDYYVLYYASFRLKDLLTYLSYSYDFRTPSLQNPYLN